MLILAALQVFIMPRLELVHGFFQLLRGLLVGFPSFDLAF